MSDLRPAKRMLSDEDATEKLDQGVAIADKYIGMTMGPKGWNVAIQRTGLGEGKLVFTKDGVSVANELAHEDPEIDMGIQAAVEASRKSNDAAGDGTTGTVVLLASLIREVRKKVKVGSNPIRMQEGMELEMQEVVQLLEKMKKPVNTEKDIYNIALVSCQNKEIAEKITKIVVEVGKYGTVGVESITGPYNIDLRVERGMFFPYGLEPRLTHMSAASIAGQLQKKGSASRLAWENDQVGLLIFDEPIRKWDDVAHIFSACVTANRRKLLLIADFHDDASVGLQTQMRQEIFSATTISRSLFMGDTGRETLKDIAVYCSSIFLSPADGTMPQRNSNITNINSILGSCTAIVGQQNFSLTAGKGTAEDITARTSFIQQAIEGGGLDDYNKQKYLERIARFKAGIGTITIIAPTEPQQQSLRTRVDDAVCAVRSANEEGIVAGGGVALVRCHQYLSRDDRKADPDPDREAGRAILREALLQPARTIASVSGEDVGVRLAQLKSHEWDSTIGYDYWTETECDLLKQGIIDPKKVVRLVVENAVSVAGELLRSRATIVRMPTLEAQTPYISPRERALQAHSTRAAQGR